MQYFPTFKAIIDHHKPRALLCDLWGVIHDGVSLYPGVIETLEYLKSQNIRVLFLSNAPRRAWVAKGNLDRLGVLPSLYEGVLSSGEVTFHYIKSAPFKKLSYIGPEKDLNILEGLPQKIVPIEESEMVICTGFDGDEDTLQHKLPELKRALKHRIPMICANPDWEVVRLDGSRALCAGVMADWYAKNGGDVKYFGKPYPEVYTVGKNLLGLKKDLLAVGDSLLTDIAGANGNDVPSVLVTGGILQESLGAKYTDKAAILEFCKKDGNVPTYSCPAFRV